MVKTSRIYIIMMWLAILLTTSCNGLFEGIYDEVEVDEEDVVTDTLSNTIHVVNLNVTDYNSWIYLDLSTGKCTDNIQIPTTLTGEWDGKSGISYKHGLGDAMTLLSSMKTDTQPDASTWDIAIHHFDVKTNGLSAYESDYTSLDQLPNDTEWLKDVQFVEDEWTTSQVLYDLNGMLNFDIGYQNSYVNRVLTNWVTMDFSTPPPIYNMSDKVRIVKMKDGSYAAIKLYNYMKGNGAKGYLTFDIKKYE